MANDSLFGNLKRHLVVDLFSGGGGASHGMHMAGRTPTVAINHNADAIAMHAANHPTTEHFMESVYDVKPSIASRGRKPDILWASPQCFPAGTLIFTRFGLRAIELVAEGDEVLTHRGRWRRVVATVTKEARTVEIRGQGHYGLVTTPDHPFYSKRINKRYPGRRGPDGRRPGTIREVVENPFWPVAETMVGKLWATPRVFPESFIPTCSGIEFSDDFFYWLGRWVGDGSVSKGDALICTGHDDAEMMSLWFAGHPIRRADGTTIDGRTTDERTARMIAWGNAALVAWLGENFGSMCDGKRLPAWLFSIQAAWRRAFLTGYVDADGHRCARTETSSVSRALSIGVRLLVVSLGYTAALYKSDGRSGEIEGRPFVGQDAYRVCWREENQKETSFSDTLHHYTFVKEVTQTGRQELVFCLQVDEDESYVADGIVVHNCTHFSRARGGAPKSEQSRSLAWVVVDWAREVSPRCIVVENVPEWATWGPLDDLGEPIKGRAGETFGEFIAALRELGYAVEHRLLVAADYGSPTSRKRLYLVARRDGRVRWPEPTHGRGRKPYRTAAECIDWSIPIPSIFTRKKPLAAATQRRIAEGIRRFVLNNPHPFLLTVTHGGLLVPLTDPIPTVTAARCGEAGLATPFIDKMYSSARAGQQVDEPAATVTGGGLHAALVTPYLTRTDQQSDGHLRGLAEVGEPVRTVTSGGGIALVAPSLLCLSHGGQYAPVDQPIRTLTATPDGGDQCLVAPTLVHIGNGERDGQSPRVYDVEKPLGTVVASGQKHGLVSAFLARHFSGCEGGDLLNPMPTVTAVDHNSVVAVHLMANNSNNAPHGADEPLGSITTGNRHFAVAAFCSQQQGRSIGRPADDPLGTATQVNHHAVVSAELAAPFLTNGHSHGWDTPENSAQSCTAPVPTVVPKDARLLVAAFMQAYYGTDEGRNITDPMGTVVTKDRFGLVTVTILGEPYVITDIGMRMLQPRELATAQGFPPEYVLTGTKTSQVARIGNSVCPQVAEAIVRANL